jgi:hypothetical protein
MFLKRCSQTVENNELRQKTIDYRGNTGILS